MFDLSDRYVYGFIVVAAVVLLTLLYADVKNTKFEDDGDPTTQVTEKGVD